MFEVEVDSSAKTWLEEHPSDGPLVVAFDVHRCCGGGKICRVTVRERSGRDDDETYVQASSAEGRPLLIDRRAAQKLPGRFGLTLRGIGRWKHLDLALEPDQWGDLLYS
jgi:hypothetical protein